MARIKPVLLFFAIAFLSCRQPRPQDSENEAGESRVNPDLLISCEGIGPVKLYDTYDDLEKRYTKEALSEHENNINGKYTVIWEGTPREINIFWEEKSQPYRNISYLEIENDSSPYRTQNGLMLGVKGEDLQHLNGDLSVSFHNFNDADNPGEIISFNRGDLDKTNSNCLGGSLNLIRAHNIDVKELNDFNNEKVVTTAHKLMNRMDTELSSITVGKKQQ